MDVEGLEVLASEETALHEAFGFAHHHHGHLGGLHRGQVPTAIRIYALGGRYVYLSSLREWAPTWEIGPWSSDSGWGPAPQSNLYSVHAPAGWELLYCRMHLRADLQATQQLAPVWTSPDTWRFGYVWDGKAWNVPPSVALSQIRVSHVIVMAYMRPFK